MPLFCRTGPLPKTLQEDLTKTDGGYVNLNIFNAKCFTVILIALMLSISALESSFTLSGGRKSSNGFNLKDFTEGRDIVDLERW